MKKWVIIILLILLILLTIVSVRTYLNRSGLGYNAEGNYFDQDAGIVYHEQAVLFYGSISVVLLLLAFLVVRRLKTEIFRK